MLKRHSSIPVVPMTPAEGSSTKPQRKNGNNSLPRYGDGAEPVAPTAATKNDGLSTQARRDRQKPRKIVEGLPVPSAKTGKNQQKNREKYQQKSIWGGIAQRQSGRRHSWGLSSDVQAYGD
jgi:hypothetical protein